MATARFLKERVLEAAKPRYAAYKTENDMRFENHEARIKAITGKYPGATYYLGAPIFLNQEHHLREIIALAEHCDDTHLSLTHEEAKMLFPSSVDPKTVPLTNPTQEARQ